MKRMFSFLFATLLLLTTVIACFPVTVAAESLYIRKIVSVVYDDSTSMYGDKWAYANYAMQAFCGMLNSEDRLFITYMNGGSYNNYNSIEIDLSAGGIKASVDGIRSHSDSGGTPYGAVDAAYQKLKSIQDTNPNTEYWLVVITDGDFNELGNKNEAKKTLNEDFGDYTNEMMPNGSNPQITFLGIGNVTAPDEDESKGIYTYSASNANDIIGAMSDMADRISGRTRLQKSDITQLDEQTLQVSSSIPLLNIAVFVQGTDAELKKVVYSDEREIPISRKAMLSFPNYKDLVGGAYLAGDTQNIIGSGTYKISFDRKVDMDDVIILFEPALETRMTITVNGKEITDLSELDNTMEGDKISVSCKIYEMGTDIEVDPSLLPPDTKFEITVTEDGKVKELAAGEEMELTDYELKHIDTIITASVLIDGFNPIERKVQFFPVEYVQRIVYTMSVDYENGIRSVKYNDISQNNDLVLCFTVYADGTPITDSAAVQALNPTISVDRQGNNGALTYSSDGKILFTPNVASAPSPNVDHYEVKVTCTLPDGTSATGAYTVLVAEYEVIAVGTNDSIVKTEFYNNQIGVSFYITKDGVQLGKSEVENGISVLLNEAHADLKTNVVINGDGTINVTPYSDEEYELNFWTWWINWWRYFNISGEDVKVTLSHTYGTADTTIDVVQEDVTYIVLNVALPLAIEVITLAYLLWWIYAIIAKPKFLPDAAIYMAYLSYGGTPGNRYHEISTVDIVTLKKYNKFKYRWKPTLKPKAIGIGKGLNISAGYGGSILCNSQVWYKGDITPYDLLYTEFDHPIVVKRYVEDNDGLKINLISPYEAGEVQAVETLNGPYNDVYYVHTKLSDISPVDGIETIESGTIFAYALKRND